jgi:hypothetical protein
VASEKQIVANRANAKRSTGPKTLAGKMASSRNAFRHGLSVPLQLDPMISPKLDAIAQALASEQADEDWLMSAADFAQAQLRLLRIRAARTELMATIGPNYNDTHKLCRVAAFDRYERYCFTKRRRASNKLRMDEDDARTREAAKTK